MSVLCGNHSTIQYVLLVMSDGPNPAKNYILSFIQMSGSACTQESVWIGKRLIPGSCVCVYFQDTQIISQRTEDEVSGVLMMLTNSCIHICSTVQLLTVIHYISVQCPFLSYSITQKIAMKIIHWKGNLYQKDRMWRKAWKNRKQKQRRLKRKLKKVCQ